MRWGEQPLVRCGEDATCEHRRVTNERFGWGAGASGAALDGVAPASELGRDLGADADAAAVHVGLGQVGDGRAGGGQAGGARAGGGGVGGIGFRTSYRDDLALLAAAGHIEVRLPLEWARIEPANGRVDDAEVEHVRLVLAAARELGLAVWATLVDGTLPGWFAHDERGFADERSRSYFWARHVEGVGESFGDLVDGWIPVHEPNRWAHRGWITGTRPPRRTADGRGFAAALEGVLLASVDAARRLRGGGHPVATSTWVVPLFAARPDPDTPADAATEAATSAADRVLWGTFHRLLTEEVVAVGDRSPITVPGARDVFDEIGFTYRQAAAVRSDGALLPYPQTLAPDLDGRVPWAHGFGLALHHVADAFTDRPIRVTGVGAATADDGRQEEYVREVVDIAVDASDGGMDLRGLWWEHPIDGPTTPGRGLFDADRAPRPSAAPWGRR